MLDETQIAAVRDGDVEKIKARADRRSMLRRAGLGLAGVAAATALTSETASAQAITDAVIFNFALNFEYLGAEYYLRGVTGQGLSAYSAVTGTGTQGTVTGGSLVPFKTTALAYYGQQLANDELAHVLAVRTVLGSAAIAEPTIDLVNSWTTLAMAAGLITSGQTFNPYADEVSFLLGAYVLEDVCVTALAGAAALLTDPTNIAYAASFLAAEGYQAGAIRGFLSDVGAGTVTNAISALRATLSGVGDNGTTIAGNAFNLTNVDLMGLNYRRTPQQVLAIAYGSNVAGTAGGLFFPNGVNGSVTIV
nr:ferritin-like domain-containing protein [uncultured Lichenicoccus sp.]